MREFRHSHTKTDDEKMLYHCMYLLLLYPTVGPDSDERASHVVNKKPALLVKNFMGGYCVS